MTSPISKTLLAALLLLIGVQATADDTVDPNVVPVTQEPRHRLVLEDEYMRLFDVHIPSRNNTLYHSHLLDSIYIPVSGHGNLLNQEYGKAAKSLAFKPGTSAVYVEHSKFPFTHRVLNLGTEMFHVMDIELIASLKEASPSQALPVGHQLVLDNSRVRISRIALEPKQSVAGHSTPAPHGITIVLTGSRLGIRGDSGATRMHAVVPGQFFIRSELASREIHNEGNDRLELVSVELK